MTIDKKMSDYVDHTRDYLQQLVCQIIKVYLQSASIEISNSDATLQQIEADKERLIDMVNNLAEVEKRKVKTH
tara:strand:- start:85 stop:303 length:219 start_codon:yes stop_codon:yes gene_type:complete